MKLYKKLMKAARSGDLRNVEILPSGNLDRVLMLAAEDGHLDIVEYMCSLLGVDPAADDNHAIQAAAGHGK